MRDYTDIDPEDFRVEVENMDETVLEDFVAFIKDDILELESMDFFGTEGLNSRFR